MQLLFIALLGIQVATSAVAQSPCGEPLHTVVREALKPGFVTFVADKWTYANKDLRPDALPASAPASIRNNLPKAAACAIDPAYKLLEAEPEKLILNLNNGRLILVPRRSKWN